MSSPSFVSKNLRFINIQVVMDFNGCNSHKSTPYPFTTGDCKHIPWRLSRKVVTDLAISWIVKVSVTSTDSCSYVP